VGDKFTATVTVPVYVNGRTIIPAGSIIEGRVTQVTPAKRMNRSGTIAIDFDELVFPNGTAVGLMGILTSEDPETRRRIDDESRVSAGGSKRPAVFIGGGGAIGAVLGGIAGGGKGAAVGGAVGAGAGVASILLSKGEEAEVPSGTPFGVQIKQALVIRESFVSEGQPAVDSPPDQLPERRDDRNDRAEADRAQPDSRDRRPPPERSEPETDVDRSEPPADNLPLSSPVMVSRAQSALKEQGYYEGATDGVMTPRTSSALRTYQRENKLQETGDLDPPTAQKLGIMGGGTAERPSTSQVPSAGERTSRADRPSERPPDASNSRQPDRTTESLPAESEMAFVISATANKTQDGAISVLINTQANSGGWRWFGEHVINGDTLEVYARAVGPKGMATQVMTRGRIELTVKDGVEYVRRVVVHSADGDQAIALGRAAAGRPAAVERPSVAANRPANVESTTSRPTPATSRPVNVEPAAPSGTAALSANSLQRKADELLVEYQRLYGVRMTGNGVEVDNVAQYREPEIELLFAIDSFANAAQLYARLASSFRDRQSLRGATLAMARQARRTDRVISTTTSRGADPLAVRWDSVRQDVLRIMQAYNINSAEVEN
jgi:hypothetical protein